MRLALSVPVIVSAKLLLVRVILGAARPCAPREAALAFEEFGWLTE